MSENSKDDSIDFGYREVPKAEKQELVREVFDSVANKYDLMNDLMSLGIHRVWKHFATEACRVRAGERVLDIAAGSGDLSAKFAKLAGDDGLVVVTDINAAMLGVGRDRLTDRGIVSNVTYSQANAEKLPFCSNWFDLVTISFGLRNVTDKDAALRSMYRVLKPGGRVMILEFSHPTAPGLKPIYDAYSFKVLPWLGEKVVGDSESYQYLAESIRMHPDQETLKGMMESAGFERCSVNNLSGGIVAVHRGYKLQPSRSQ